MAKKRQSGQAPAGDAAPSPPEKKVPRSRIKKAPDDTPHVMQRLVWADERFLKAYFRCGRFADAWYEANPKSVASRNSARSMAWRAFQRLKMDGSVKALQARLQAEMRIEQADIIRGLIGMALTTPDEVLEVIQHPSREESYVGLGMKKHALHISDTPDGVMVTMASIGERRQALNDLWEKLGFGENKQHQEDRDAVLGRFAGACPKPPDSKGT